MEIIRCDYMVQHYKEYQKLTRQELLECAGLVSTICQWAVNCRYCTFNNLRNCAQNSNCEFKLAVKSAPFEWLSVSLTDSDLLKIATIIANYCTNVRHCRYCMFEHTGTSNNSVCGHMKANDEVPAQWNTREVKTDDN